MFSATDIMASSPVKNWKSLLNACLIGMFALIVSACGTMNTARQEDQPPPAQQDSTKTTGAQDLEKLLAPQKTAPYEDLGNTPTVDPLTRLMGPQPLVIGSRAPATEAEVVKIAILLPLSGPNEAIGHDLLRAADMALFDLANPQIQLMPLDTKGTPAGAERAAAEALVGGAELILGPLFSTSVPRVQNLAAERGVNVITFSTDTSVAGNGVYVMGLTVGQQIHRVMEFAYRQGLHEFAVLAPDSAYGNAVIDSVTQTADQLGLPLDKTVRYPVNVAPGSPELHDIAKVLGDYAERQKNLAEEIKLYEGKDDEESKAYLKKLKKMDTLGEVSFDALIIPEGGSRLKELAPLLSYYDIDPEVVKFIGTGLWDDPTLSDEPALVGGWFAAPSPDKAAAFRARFKKIYGYLPSRIASLAYDGMALAGLLARTPKEGRFGRAAIENPNGFIGYDGIFRFPPNGVAERGLAVIEVTAKGQKVLEPAPTTFTALVN